MKWFKNKDGVVEKQPSEVNKFANTDEGKLLEKLRNNIEELKGIKVREPVLRHTLNDSMLKLGYPRIPRHMQMFEQFFHAVDREYVYGLHSDYYSLEDVDCVIAILQEYRNELATVKDRRQRREELEKEIQDIKKTLKIE